MLPKNFKKQLRESIFHLLWKQWTTLGLLGSIEAEHRWVIDPEALLLFTLPTARYDPRLFDEVMDWLCVNGKWLDVQRLRTILKKRPSTVHALLGAVLKAPRGPLGVRKFNALIEYCKERSEIHSKPEPLFFSDEGSVSYERIFSSNQEFLEFGFIRGELNIRKLSRPVVSDNRALLRFRLRALFGIGSRSECILYLITREGGSFGEISKSIGATPLATQQMLEELSWSGLIRIRPKGEKKKGYWADHKKWWDFLEDRPLGNFFKPIQYIDWIAFFDGLEEIWKVVNSSPEDISEYLFSSKLKDAFETAGPNFSRSGFPIPSLPSNQSEPQKYLESTYSFLTNILTH